MSRPCSSHVYQVTPDPGELGDLLAAQARGAAPAAGRQADLLGRDPLAPAAQEVGQLLPADPAAGRESRQGRPGAGRGRGLATVWALMPPACPPASLVTRVLLSTRMNGLW